MGIINNKAQVETNEAQLEGVRPFSQRPLEASSREGWTLSGGRLIIVPAGLAGEQCDLLGLIAQQVF